MLLKLHPEHLSEQKINTIVECLRKGGVIVFPTDTVYAFGCDLFQPKAIENLIKISGKKRPDFSFICDDISQAMHYTASLDQPVFKEMKRLFPGPYTIIVKASAQVTRIFGTNKKTVGIRIPDNNIARAIAKALGNPLISTSLHDENMILDYMTDPREMEADFHNAVELIVDGGMGGNLPSTVIDYTEKEPVLIRQGAGEWG
ncbi:MAG: threonylcarbamoyl-AMP synthase [Chitinophagales bacterium]|nr:threonylcarbamoyl-AMP synthase [Chitinophagales bacterium]